MNHELEKFICTATQAIGFKEIKLIQNLWSDYGNLLRVFLEGASMESVIVKEIRLKADGNHPRGWNSTIGHQRKLRSYEVESFWYQQYANKSHSRLPRCLGVEHHSDHIYILLEDLDSVGYELRKQALTWKEFSNVLQWLAQFHVDFLGIEPKGLWSVGTYWHLETRPQELEALEDVHLKSVAAAIDEKLNSCNFKTLVHGDAKLANFCFSEDGEVAGVDFQYVGGGCGIKDVAYFVGSCLSDEECERFESTILDTYFDFFHQAYGKVHGDLEKEWRALYPVAWADFHRFLKGWSPNHWKINSYSERMTNSVIKSLSL